MKSYLVLVPPGAGLDDPRALVVPDAFSLAAFVVPVLWFAWHRLWLEAAVAALVFLLPALASGVDGLTALAVAAFFAFCLLAGFEGNARRVADRHRKGWRTVDIVREENADNAYERYIRGIAGKGRERQVPPGSLMPQTQVPRPRSSGVTAAGLMPLGRDGQ